MCAAGVFLWSACVAWKAKSGCYLTDRASSFGIVRMAVAAQQLLMPVQPT
jgi:hypothetical protein